MVGIYKITSPSNKVYIGQSVEINNRWRAHRLLSGGSVKLYNSIRKYGIKAHVFEIVHALPYDISKDVLDAYEQIYMDCYRSAGIELLNLREAGSHGRHSAESRVKIGLASKGRTVTESARHKISIAHKGHQRNKGRVCSDEHRNKISAALKGSKKSEDHNRKNSESKKGSKCYMYGIESSKHHQAKRIVDTATGKTFGTIKEAAAAIGIKRTTLSMMLTGRNKNKTSLAYDA